MVLKHLHNVFLDMENLKQKKKKKVKADKLGEIQKETDFALQPSDKIAKLDTSQWPLLLKVCLLFTYMYKFLNFLLKSYVLCII